MKLNAFLTADENKKYDDFSPTISSIFRKARYFGVTNHGFSVAFIWTSILFVMLFTLETCAIWKLVRLLMDWTTKPCSGGMIVARLAGSVFYGNALVSLILSSRFIHSWQTLSVSWLRMENEKGLTIAPDVKIRKRIISVTIMVASCALVEHMLSMIADTDFSSPPLDYFKNYILSSHGFVIKPHEYNLWIAVPIFILSKLATALWNFQDLIIILISMGLASRYHRLNLYVDRVVQAEKRFKDSEMIRTESYHRLQKWRRLREAYVCHARLVRMVDRHLGPLVLLSNINNLFFICLQLFLGIHKEKHSDVGSAYYLLSLGWLIFRACSVVLAAADVHVHSQRALNFLYLCPGDVYNMEIKRLQYQLRHDFVALTGMGFFSLTRELLLVVAATIIKYELVLLQNDT